MNEREREREREGEKESIEKKIGKEKSERNHINGRANWQVGTNKDSDLKNPKFPFLVYFKI